MSARTKIDRKAEAVIAALLTESSHAAAAKKAGVSEATLQRWLRQAAFQSAYRAARRALVESAVSRLQQAADEAVQTLRRNLSCGNPAAEVRAAVAVLAQTFQGLALSDMADEIESLKTQLGGDSVKPLPAWNSNGPGPGEKGDA